MAEASISLTPRCVVSPFPSRQVHGHYADAGEIASLLAATLGVPMVLTGHSLGRNKLAHALTGGRMRRSAWAGRGGCWVKGL